MIKLPTHDELKPLVEQALAGGAEKDFIEKTLTNISKVLKKDPRQYRAYGPYWWSIKTMLNQRNVFDFGIEADQTMVTLMSKLSNAEILCAAYATKLSALDEGKLYSSEHMLIDTDNNDYQYSLDDLEMEKIIVGNA